ncbi:hypothetical protein [Desulfobulbus oligotrophicus]|uniref:HNH endonuclease n=1 Tax=Desulfobulbus oligotrophicus TaxID=1909699 RepID=A0A7T5VAY9_9BACT|nr:hypothetical protein [Desulfobulbus oligotrophicus]QQG64545.1 hypothetical protein HP555_01070 [Desulfobulbus oligotrophicus]
MTTVGTCALCRTPASILLKSHIIPEFFYKRVYTKTHKFTAIALDEEERLAIEQKGYRENLLCAVCETKLSKWEGELSRFVAQVISDSYTTCSTTQVGTVTVVNGVNYSSVKMAMLSIFWRMSIAQHNLFSLYKLGPYEEDFRNLLDQHIVPAGTEFPILLSKGTLDGKFLPGILFPMGRGRYGDHFIMQSVVLNGIVFDCFMTRTRTIPNEIVNFSLQPNGRVLIPSKSYEQLGVNIDEFSQRIRNPDVKKFYQKYL